MVSSFKRIYLMVTKILIRSCTEVGVKWLLRGPKMAKDNMALVVQHCNLSISLAF